jgi:exopolysaccharide biosynthesis protein
MGPLIINGLKFGPVNVYSPAQPKAKTQGEPSPKYAKHLVQRSNRRFPVNIGFASSTGKVVIAHIHSKNMLLILIQPHGNIGISITGLRDILSNLKVNSAVYLDGSDSVMLMVNGKFLVRAASNKNETNITSIGFKY